jgi:ATP-dependent DNA helicase RecG
MSQALLTLQKILQLEIRHGCRDRAVVGGLEAFVRRQAADFPADQAEMLLARLTGYAAVDPAQRAAAAREALGWLAALRLEPGADAGRSKVRAPAAPASRATGAPAQEPVLRDLPRVPPPLPGLDWATIKLRKIDDPRLERPVSELRGVGPRTAVLLARLGIHTIAELIWHVPARYRDYRQVARIADLVPGGLATVVGLVRRRSQKQPRPGLSIWTYAVDDGSGVVEASFFNQPFMAKELGPGDAVALSGKVDSFQGRPTFANPEWETLEAESLHTARLLPVYPLTEGLRQRWLRRMAGEAVRAYAPGLGEALPPGLRADLDLPTRPWSLVQLHFPDSEAALGRARERLAFDELLLLQLWGRRKRLAARRRPAPSLGAGLPALTALEAALPFALTGAQRRCLDEIAADLGRPWPMARLLQGDVGSGKTAVAAGAVAICVAAGHQAAIMAPTEILADQHYRGLCRILAPLGYRPFDPGAPPAADETGPFIARLVGSLTAGAKKRVAAAIADGRVDLVVGTHAVIQQGVSFPRLGLAVVDEQHRFGVLQRAELQLKAREPAAVAGGAEPATASPASDDSPAAHLLVMTATPIPRTLALAINADMDQSVIDELPPGRQPIETFWLAPDERDRAYAFIRRRAEAGEQAYIVCPLVEDSEQIQARAATAEYERLKAEVFADLRLGLLHGRMRPSEKDAVMQAFARGELDLLVATAVIEVGVDVPNATVMLIEGADRFGLAQLHQFRGRVGRGAAASACLLVADDPGKSASARLAKMTELLPASGPDGQPVMRPLSGLELAEFDLQQRGPGDYFGLQQSGVVDRFRFARLAPSRALSLAAAAAGRILEADPDLVAPEHGPLAAALAAFSEAAQRG